MFLKLLVPCYQKYIDIVINQNTSFDDLIKIIIKKCNDFNFICYKQNIRCVLNDKLITEENWCNFKNNNQYKNINGVVIIVSIPCKDH